MRDQTTDVCIVSEDNIGIASVLYLVLQTMLTELDTLRLSTSMNATKLSFFLRHAQPRAQVHVYPFLSLTVSV